MIIYKAKNLINGKYYIGQTSQLLENRIKEHLASAKYENSTYFHRSINKYGIKNFEWKIIGKAQNQEELDQKEILYIILYNARNQNFGYNLKSGGNYGKHHEKTKQKISQSKKGIPRSKETKIKLSKSKLGTKMSEEFKQNMSKRVSGKGNPMYGKHHTEETKKKISQIHKGNCYLSNDMKHKFSENMMGSKNHFYGKLHTKESKSTSIICTTTNTQYTSVRVASNILNIPTYCIYNVLFKKHKKTHGLEFKYVNKK